MPRNILRTVTLRARVAQRVLVSEPCTARTQNASLNGQLYYVREDDDTKSPPTTSSGFDTSRAKWANGPGVCNLSDAGGYWFYYDDATTSDTLTLSIETNDGGNPVSLDEEGTGLYPALANAGAATQSGHGSIAVSTALVTVLAGNRQRKTLYFCNAGAAVVVLGFGFDATATDGFRLVSGASIMLTDGLNFRGKITAIAGSGSNTLHFGEGI